MPNRISFFASLIAVLFCFAAAQTTRAQDPPAIGAVARPAPSPSPLASPAPPPIPSADQPPPATHSTHTVTVTFDYDFGQTAACVNGLPKGCVQQFIAFDISAGSKNAHLLFPIPLPAHPVGAIKGITATGPPLDFESGKHLISVAAMTPDGHHSRRSLCTTWITIP